MVDKGGGKIFNFQVSIFKFRFSILRGRGGRDFQFSSFNFKNKNSCSVAALGYNGWDGVDIFADRINEVVELV